MAHLRAVSSVARQALTSSCSQSRRLLHSTAARRAITNLEMPAMSPTMTEGGIASWKKKEGDTFTAGDVLLEIETDKATIDVEAQDDGVMGKIILPDGSKNVPVGKVIALLAEEGDDISNLEVPKEEPKPAKSASASSPPSAQEPAKSIPDTPTPKPIHGHAPSHSRPLFPSVLRLLTEHGISDPEKIKGTGVRGMLTKGDVLAFLGKASGPTGTFKESPSPIEEATKNLVKKDVVPPPMDGPAIRRLIVTSMYQSSVKARAVPVFTEEPDFDSIIADYLPPAPKAAPKTPSAPASKPKSDDFLAGLV